MDQEALIADSDGRRAPVKPAFNDKTIKGLSIAVLVLGVVCFAAGGATLTVSLVAKCAYKSEPYYDRHNSYDSYNYGYTTTTTTTTTTTSIGMCYYRRTYTSPGMWSGLMFIACGIIGLLAAKRKTTCFIVTLMTMSIVSNWIAVAGFAMSVAAHFDHYWLQINPYPISLHVLDSVISLICLICFILQWIKFGFTCKAVCCDGKKGYPIMKSRQHHYQPLSTQPMMFGGPSMPQAPIQQPPHPVFNPSNMQTSAAPQPVYLVQGHQIIGVLPQNATLAAAPATSETTAVQEQTPQHI